MITRNKKNLAALNKENCEKHPRSNWAQNSSAPRSQEDYITQFSEEIDGTVTKRMSKEFSSTENRILGALAQLDDFLMNPLLPGYSGTTPEPTRNAINTSQRTNEDDSQNDPHPEAGLFHGQMTQNSGPEDDHDMVTGATETNRNRYDMVTGATEQIGNCHVMTEFPEEVTNCSPSTSTGKQKKNRSASQAQFRSVKTHATIEVDQILLAPQQLANNNNSANFHNNVNRVSKLPTSLSTTMPTFDWKFEKFELFEDLFQTSLKLHNQLTEDD